MKYFQKSTLCMHSYRDDNHYKFRLSKGTFKNTFITFSKLETFSKAQHFVYVLTNKNYYKVCLNDGAFSKYIQKTTQITFSNKSSTLCICSYERELLQSLPKR